MSDAKEQIQCSLHGKTAATFMCRHLRAGVGCGYHRSGEDGDDPWPDAWCDACNAAFEREGKWTESNSPEITVLCTGCYETARERNGFVPAPIAPGQTSVSDDELAALAEAACERCKVRQDESKARWGWGTRQHWHYDDEAGTLRFFDDGRADAVVADATVTGSFSTRTNTWMWAWGNQNYSDEARTKVDPVRVFGEVRGIEKLASVHWPAEEVDGWEVTQIAADLLGAEAIYRAPMEHVLVFMLLSNFRIEHPS